MCVLCKSSATLFHRKESIEISFGSRTVYINYTIVLQEIYTVRRRPLLRPDLLLRSTRRSQLRATSYPEDCELLLCIRLELLQHNTEGIPFVQSTINRRYCRQLDGLDFHVQILMEFVTVSRTRDLLSNQRWPEKAPTMAQITNRSVYAPLLSFFNVETSFRPPLQETISDWQFCFVIAHLPVTDENIFMFIPTQSC